MFHCFRYFCLPGYQINDRQDYNITCGKGGSWVSTWSTSDFHPASCQPVLCVGSPPPPIPNSAWVKGIDPSSSATTGDVGFLHHKLRLMLLRAYWLQMHRQSKQWLLNIPKGFPFYTNMTSFSYPYNCDSLICLAFTYEIHVLDEHAPANQKNEAVQVLLYIQQWNSL